MLLFDIETFANLGYTWGRWEQNVIAFQKEGYMLTFAYKWLGEKTIHARGLPDFPMYKKDKENDKQLVTELWDLFNEADVIIGHHLDSFDIRKSNAFFAKAGLPPPSPYKTVDTKKIAKRYFFFNSNKLDDIGNYLGLGRKIDTGGFDLWLDCRAGDLKAWKKMLKYNKQDVALLEQVYLKLLPWIKNHPDQGLKGECPNCGSSHLNKRGIQISRKGKSQRLQCINCGAWSSLKLKNG